MFLGRFVVQHRGPQWKVLKWISTNCCNHLDIKICFFFSSPHSIRLHGSFFYSPLFPYISGRKTELIQKFVSLFLQYSTYFWCMLQPSQYSANKNISQNIPTFLFGPEMQLHLDTQSSRRTIYNY